MAQPLTADDLLPLVAKLSRDEQRLGDLRRLWFRLLPLVAKLSRDEQVRLIQLALRSAGDATRDAAAYENSPVRPDEFSQDEEGASWEGEGW